MFVFQDNLKVEGEMLNLGYFSNIVTYINTTLM